MATCRSNAPTATGAIRRATTTVERAFDRLGEIERALPSPHCIDLTCFVIGALTIEERRHHHRDMVRQHREHLVATGAIGVPSFAEAWQQTRLWVTYIQAWAANLDAWGQNGVPMNERFFTAAEDYGTWQLLGE